MKPWRDLRDRDVPDLEVNALCVEVETTQQQAACRDDIIVAWINEMMYREGYTRMITVMDLFAGALSETAMMPYAVCSSDQAWAADH